MRTRWIGVVVLVLLVASGGWLMERRRANAQERRAPAAARRSVELTVYPQDFALVREARPVRLARGGNALRLREVSRSLDPRSVLLRWTGEGGNLPQLVAHSYDPGVGDGAALLRRYLGREVELVRYGENGREAERQKGTLVAEEGGQVVLRSQDAFFVRPTGTVVAPAEGEVEALPQLALEVQSGAAQGADLELAYLTRGLSWSADYVTTTDPKAGTLALECWATVTNATGADYPGAKVTLMAGTVNRAARLWPAADMMAGGWAAAGGQIAEGHPRFAQRSRSAPNLEGGLPEPVGEGQAYHVKGPATVAQDRVNRLLLLSAQRVPVTRDYSTRPPALTSWEDGYEWGVPSRPRRGAVAVAFALRNREADGLGVALPAGRLRVYEPDRSGSLRYAGAATLPDTPRDARIHATLANAFDLYTQERLVRSSRPNRRTARKQAEIALHNERGEAAEVRVVQGFSSGWRIMAQSAAHRRLDANTAEWRIRVPAGGRTVLRFTVEMPG